MIIGSVFFVILLSWDIGEKMGLNTCSEPRKQGFPQIKRLWAEKWQCCNKRGLPTTGLAMEGLLALPRHEISICFLLNALPRWGAEGASPGHSARTEAWLRSLGCRSWSVALGKAGSSGTMLGLSVKNSAKGLAFILMCIGFESERGVCTAAQACCVLEKMKERNNIGLCQDLSTQGGSQLFCGERERFL